jgi:hypothetical protein
MGHDANVLQTLIDKEAIRELVLLYSRGVDRKDGALLRTLYSSDATDTHGDTFDGPAGAYVDFLERSFPYMRYSGHHVCNHLIAGDGDHGEGEVYALAYHAIPDGKGGWQEDLMAVRYIDRYRKEDGRWKFAQRVVTYDYKAPRRPLSAAPDAPASADDPSHTVLKQRLFAAGPRR